MSLRTGLHTGRALRASSASTLATTPTRLVAELGAAFLCGSLGITPEARDDHASYIAHWLKVLKSDKRAIFAAAAHAQRAVDYLHGLHERTAAA